MWMYDGTKSGLSFSSQPTKKVEVKKVKVMNRDSLVKILIIPYVLLTIVNTSSTQYNVDYCLQR